MRKLIGLAVLIVALAIPTAALAATLSNGNSQTCGASASWHFVNNQTGGAGAGLLTATFNTPSGTLVITTGPTAVLNNTQHFWVDTPGAATLVNATTNLPGRLQLSELQCGDDKKDPPKK